MLPLKRSEEVVVVKEMEWRASSTSPQGRWEALRRSNKTSAFARDGRFISTLSEKRFSSTRRVDGARYTKQGRESARLKDDLFEVIKKLNRAELRNDVLEAEVKILREEVERLSKKS